MDFLEATPVTFKEITPNPCITEKWKEVILNTGKIDFCSFFSFVALDH